MAKDKKEVNIHIMHSMKGGCGKSTCALFKTLQIAHEHCGGSDKQEAEDKIVNKQETDVKTASKQNIVDKTAHVLYLDADFKGSAMIKILFRKDDPRIEVLSDERLKLEVLADGAMTGGGLLHTFAIPDNYKPDKTLSNYLKGSSQLYMRDIIYHSCSYLLTEKKDAVEDTLEHGQEVYINGFVDFILSSASSKSKDWFRHKQGKIPAGVYSYRMEALIRGILNEGVVNKEERGVYEDIVIDMPPGYDEYSDILLDILRGIAEESEDIKLHYYAVTTQDIGHKALTKDNIQKMIRDTTDYKPFFSVNLVLSAVSPKELDNMKDTEKEDYRSWVKVDGDVKGRVYENVYSESYHNFCRDETIGEFEENIDVVLKELSQTKGPENGHGDKDQP